MTKNHIKNKSKFHLLSRREILLLAGGFSFASIAGFTGRRAIAQDLDKIVGCVVSREQTAGSYFVDERLNRKDIGSDPKDKSIKAVVLLNLELSVFQVGEKTCEPLKNAMVDIWHCAAERLYSDVEDIKQIHADRNFCVGIK